MRRHGIPAIAITLVDEISREMRVRSPEVAHETVIKAVNGVAAHAVVSVSAAERLILRALGVETDDDEGGAASWKIVTSQS